MKSAEQFALEIKNINPNILILESYTRATNRIKVQCKACGKIWAPKAYSLLQGKGCPSCSAHLGAVQNKGKTGLKTEDVFLQEMANKHPDITIIGTYVNTHSDIGYYCNRCGYQGSSKPYSLLQGHGCPRCAKSGTSFMEQAIYLSFVNALGENQVISRDRKCIGMELDIYIPSYSVAVEIGNWNLHEKSITRDNEKRLRCKNRGIKLITIYDNYPQGKPPIFESQFFSYTQDLNKADHSLLRELINKLFITSGILELISDSDWVTIQKLAYEKSKSITHEDFVNRLKNIQPTIEVLGRYQNANRKIQVKCGTCGYIWFGVPANMLRGDGCEKCGVIKAHASTRKKQEEFVNELKIINPTIEIIGEYKGRHSPVKVRCKICGLEWSPTAGSLLRGSTHKGAASAHRILLEKDWDND